jgi:hypothetical protein
MCDALRMRWLYSTRHVRLLLYTAGVQVFGWETLVALTKQTSRTPDVFLARAGRQRMQLLVLSEAVLTHRLIQLSTPMAALHGGTAIPVGEAARGGGGGAAGVKPPCAPVEGTRM